MEKKLILDLQKTSKKNQRKNGLLRNRLFFNIMRVGQPEKVTGQWRQDFSPSKNKQYQVC